MSIKKSAINPKRKIAIGMGVCLASLLAIFLLALSCCNMTPKDEADYMYDTVEQEDFAQVESREKSPEPEAKPTAIAGGATQSQSAPNAEEAPRDIKTAGPSNHSSMQNQNDTRAETAPAQPIKNTSKTWIVDQPAWTESVPIYASREVSICNVCGADITGNTSAHGKQHMLAGEGSGHHSEVIQVQTGTETISHPEEGHWE